MEDVIKEIYREKLNDGRTRFMLLFVHTPTRPISIGANTIGLTPRGSLSDEVKNYGFLTPDQLTALDDGLLMAREKEVFQNKDKSELHLIALARSDFGKFLGWIEGERRRWAHAGESFNATA